MVHGCSWREDESMASSGQSVRELLILVQEELLIESAVRQKDIAPVGRSVGIHKVNSVCPSQPVIFLFMLGLYETGHQRPLSRLIDALNADHIGFDKRPQHLLDPVGQWLAISVGEKQNRTACPLSAEVACRGGSSVILVLYRQ